MAALKLSHIMGANDRLRSILDGTIQPDGMDLVGTISTGVDRGVAEYVNCVRSHPL